MKAAILALLAIAVTTIEEAQGEMRERMCEPTNLKFEALKRDMHTAIVEGVSEPEEAAAAAAAVSVMPFNDDQVSAFIEKLGDHLGDRLALEVRAALDEAQAA